MHKFLYSINNGTVTLEQEIFKSKKFNAIIYDIKLKRITKYDDRMF